MSLAHSTAAHPAATSSPPVVIARRPHPPAPDASLRPALRLALIFASVKVAIQIAVNLVSQRLGYGPFRDELYYLVCGRRLAWGYVDQQSLVAVVARVTELLFGVHSLALLALFSALAGGVMVALSGLVTGALGGSALAQGVVMTAVIAVPEYIGIDSFLSMNSLEPVFWMVCTLAVLLLARGGLSRRRVALCWLVCGVSGGLALENKLSAVFFLTCLLLALALTPQRRLMRSRWFAAAVGVAVLLELPNFLWQLARHFPTLQLLSTIARSHKNVVRSPAAFVLDQIFILNPFSVCLWGAGLVWLLFHPRARRFRFAGLLYLLFLALMIVLHAKNYYVVPIYPLLFAAGGVALQTWFGSRPRVLLGYAAVLLLLTAIALPMIVPIVPPQDYPLYARYLPVHPTNSEMHVMGPLPQFFADRRGWQQLADKTTALYTSLPQNEREQACIWADNYGDASAINVLAHGLPFAISGHQNYYYWGPQGCTGKVMIILGSDGFGLSRKFDSCETRGTMDDPYALPEEQRHIYLCRGLHMDLQRDWSRVKVWY